MHLGRFGLIKIVYFSLALAFVQANAFALTWSQQLSQQLSQQIDAIYDHDETREAFIADLTKELNANVRTLKRTVRVYHYGNLGGTLYTRGSFASDPLDVSFLTVNNDEAIDVNESADEYFRIMTQRASIDSNRWLVGLGLYAAVDPVQSQQYAGNPWFLLELEVPKGTRYLELRPSNGIQVSHDFIDRWLKSLEPLITFKDEVDDLYLISWNQIATHSKLHAMISSLFQKQKIQMLSYSWQSPGYSFCARSQIADDGIAFNFINPDFLKQGLQMKMFTQKLEASDSVEKKAEYSRLLDLIEMGTVAIDVKQHPVVHHPISLLTVAWAKVLNRSSLFAKLVFGSEDEALQSALHFSQDTQSTALQKTPDFLVQQLVDGSVVIQPEKYLTRTDPIESARRIKMIRNQTYGCSLKAKFDSEWSIVKSQK